MSSWNWCNVVAELVGSSIFIGVIIMHSDNPIAIGVALSAVIFLFAKISGGHFNPAVSTVMYLQKKIGRNEWIVYMISQILGGLLALYFLKHCSSSSISLPILPSIPTVATTLPTSSPFPTYSSLQQSIQGNK